MQIKLNHFIPKPLVDNFAGVSDLWKKEDLHISQYNTVLVTSPSGKGKSSLISSIYGLRKDYEGTITLDDKLINTCSPKELSTIRERKLSIVFQNLMLFPELSALDNVLVKNRLTQHKSNSEIESLFEQLGISAQLNQSAGSLSFGQQQRVAIIRALCQPFENLLLDEPFSHLDIENTELAWNIILEESKQQSANIIITALNNNELINTNQIFNI